MTTVMTSIVTTIMITINTTTIATNHVEHQVGRVLEEQEGVQGAVGRQHAELEGGEVEGDSQQPTTSPRELWTAPHQYPNLFFPKS